VQEKKGLNKGKVLGCDGGKKGLMVQGFDCWKNLEGVEEKRDCWITKVLWLLEEQNLVMKKRKKWITSTWFWVEYIKKGRC
jgi:hypothetical protein